VPAREGGDRYESAERDAGEAAEEDRLTASLAGLAVALLVVVAGLFLIQHLRDKARVEDCLMAGRFNCDAVLGSALR
jgi:uncharacterized membrane protein